MIDDTKVVKLQEAILKIARLIHEGDAGGAIRWQVDKISAILHLENHLQPKYELTDITAVLDCAWRLTTLQANTNLQNIVWFTRSIIETFYEDN